MLAFLNQHNYFLTFEQDYYNLYYNIEVILWRFTTKVTKPLTSCKALQLPYPFTSAGLCLLQYLPDCVLYIDHQHQSNYLKYFKTWSVNIQRYYKHIQYLLENTKDWKRFRLNALSNFPITSLWITEILTTFTFKWHIKINTFK
jgi:hypothetical protein